jgi:putative SOS response-associated peptidase YedK
MCGKFTAMASFAQILAFSQPLSADRDYAGRADRQVNFRVMSDLRVIIFNHVQGRRRVVPVRWSFPHPKD